MARRFRDGTILVSDVDSPPVDVTAVPELPRPGVAATDGGRTGPRGAQPGDADAVRPVGSFSDRVVVLLVTQVAQVAIGIMNGILLARLLGPTGKGEYYLLTLLPATLTVLVQLGLAQAFGFFAARSQTQGLFARSLSMTLALSLPAIVVTAALLPMLRATILRDLDPTLIVVGLWSLPLLLSATFATSIVMGRQAVRWNAVIGIAQGLATTLLFVLLLGVAGFGVGGALAAFLVAAAIQAAGFLLAASLVLKSIPNEKPATYGGLVRYGLPFYPGSITLYFGYRADVYLLAALLMDSSAAVGYYSMAVSMAEMVFFVPNAVEGLFFPRVAASTRVEADQQVASVCRVTLVASAAAAIILVPVAVGLVHVILPAFKPSLAALYVLLPGVVALSNTKVLSGYVSGLGMTGTTSAVHVTAFVFNVLVNVLLIPRYGIVGAAASSLISYAASSVMFSWIAARLAGRNVLEFWIPRASDVRYAMTQAVTLGQRTIHAVARHP